MIRRFAGAVAAALIVYTLAGVFVGSGAAQPAPGRPAPEISAGRWVNSAPLTIERLRGRVVLVEFWTFG